MLLSTDHTAGTANEMGSRANHANRQSYDVPMKRAKNRYILSSCECIGQIRIRWKANGGKM